MSEQLVIPQLEKSENARWLALLIDTEGTLGWAKLTRRMNKLNKIYRYTYHYMLPYITIDMSEIESKATVDEATWLMSVSPYTMERKVKGKLIRMRRARVHGKRALAVMQYCLQYFVKQKRMATLCLTLLRYRTEPERKNFKKAIEQLFGKYLLAKEANRILLTMPQEEYEELIKKAEKLAPEYLI
jgi:hypothetical protein